jgi:hypothetical protein
MDAKELTDDELIARIEETANYRKVVGLNVSSEDVAELVRRYRSARAELDRALDRRWPPVPPRRSTRR